MIRRDPITELRRQISYNRTIATKTRKNAEERAQQFEAKADRIELELEAMLAAAEEKSNTHA